MDFSSLPVNQFDSHNWQQQGNQHQLERVTTDQSPNNYLPKLLSPPASHQAGSSQPRVNSMVERARMAKVPLPEAALKCPRCDSTNTKFCYFNNYNLTQPRHFCKTCRRYWTRGGALRNVPVGGGFRRNKKSKSNGGSSSGRSKSTVVVSTDNILSPLTSHPSQSNPSKFLNYGQNQGFTFNLPIVSPYQSLGDYNPISNMISGMSSSGEILDPWRISSMQKAQQFPFLINTTGLDQSTNGLCPLLECNESVNDQAYPQQESSDYSNQLIRSKPLMDLDRDRDVNGSNTVTRNDEYTSGGGNNSINSSWTGFTNNNSTGHVSF